MAAAAVPMAAQVVGGLITANASRGSQNSAADSVAAAQQRLQEIGLPPDLSKQIIFQQFQQAGILTPELEHQINAGPSAVAGVRTDQDLKARQTEALNALKQRGGAGLTPEERAQFGKIQQQMAADEESKRQQIMQQAQMRGQAGGGSELAAQLLASQAEANRASEAGAEMSGQASQRALQSLMQGGQLAGQMSGQQFSQDVQRSQAQDELNRFNIQNQQAQQARNVGSQNQAQLFNLQNLQGIQNQNVGQYNTELLRQNAAKQQFWNSRLQQATGQAQADQSAANAYNQMAANTQTAGAAMTGGIAKGLQTAFENQTPAASTAAISVPTTQNTLQYPTSMLGGK